MLPSRPADFGLPRPSGHRPRDGFAREALRRALPPDRLGPRGGTGRTGPRRERRPGALPGPRLDRRDGPFEVPMPGEGWTGRFMFHAPGGLTGVIGDTSSLLDDRLAMARTDTGHEPEKRPVFLPERRRATGLRLPRQFPGDGAGKADHPRVLRPARRVRASLGLLERRARRTDGGAAFSGRLRRDHRRGAARRQAGRPGTGLSSCTETHRYRSAVGFRPAL